MGVGPRPGSKPLTTPGRKLAAKAREKEAEPFEPREANRFRQLAVGANVLASDRQDAAFAVDELRRGIAAAGTAGRVPAASVPGDSCETDDKRRRGRRHHKVRLRGNRPLWRRRRVLTRHLLDDHGRRDLTWHIGSWTVVRYQEGLLFCSS